MIEFQTNKAEVIRDVNQFIDEWNSDTSTITVHTSGSTGTPKKITLQKKHLRTSAQMTGEHLKLKPKSTALLCLPISTIAGKMMVVRSLVLELNLIVVEPSKSPLNDCSQKIDFAAMVPMQVLNSIENNKEKFKKIETIIIGGAPISPSLIKQISGCHSNAYQTFGMTETISHIAMRRIKEVNTSYIALPNVTFTENNNCLVITAPSIGVT